MSKTVIPAGYCSCLSLYETQTAIGIVKRTFEDNLAQALHLKRVSAPLFVDPATGLNDDLNGYERAVAFDIAETGLMGQVVHSLAKWKRMALHKYGFQPGEGIYADMNAIRRDEEMDNLHSIYVDQWDWCKVITPAQRNRAYLEATVQTIVDAIYTTWQGIKAVFPQIPVTMAPHATVITTQELEDMYPNLSPKERENAFTKAHGTVFLLGIGGTLRSGKPHDGRAPDYDDWTLNGDILCWDALLDCAIELSSMGIRVDAAALDRQLTLSGCDDRRRLDFHKQLLAGELPLTIGGGIGQSRLCMLMLHKAHVGEVQASIWDAATHLACDKAGVELL